MKDDTTTLFKPPSGTLYLMPLPQVDPKPPDCPFCQGGFKPGRIRVVVSYPSEVNNDEVKGTKH